jgi:ATP-dependent DNA helicase DinG
MTAMDDAIAAEGEDRDPTPTTFAEAEARLAKVLPGYESRQPQQVLAGAIEDALDECKHVLAEAGCGTGKSLGALIPAILSGKRVVYSTATKALQEQVAGKDLPFLKDHLGVDFSFALLKGRSNYFCLAKAVDADPRYVPVDAMLKELDANPHHSGDREHFKTVSVDEKSFRNVAATSEECPGKRKCPFGDQCYAEFAKARAKAADVVVTNHMLTFTDVKIREVTHGFGSMLGDVDAYIFDEAHEIEEIATNAIADVVRESGVRKLAVEIQNYLIDHRDPNANAIGQDIQAALAHLWDRLPTDDGATMTKAWFVNNFEPFADLMDTLKAGAEAVEAQRPTDSRDEARQTRLSTRAMNYASSFRVAMLAADDTLVRWIEHDDKKNRLFKHAPLRIGPWLDAGIWSRVIPSTVTDDNPDGEPVTAALMSATLSVGGKFDYLLDRLGLPEDTRTLNVGTPFDFSTQAMLYVPDAKLPSPKDRQAWMTTTPIITMDLIDASGGGALLLYTSRSAMQQAYATMAPRLKAKGYTVFMQGQDGTNKEIASAFQADEHSILFALKSFFTGVDFGGDTCRLVVIDKMPFAVPTDVMFKARSEEVERHGGRPFSDLTIPMMTLTLLQGFGRLIRTKSDRGVVAILDSRLSSTPYGRKIVEAMPPAPVTHSLEDVRAFYRR